MADDTRQPQTAVKEDLSREALTVHPENKPFAGKQWQDSEAQQHRPLENANMIPGGTQNTAGGKVPEVSLANAVKMIKMEEFKEIHKKPCNRQAFMTGIGAGFALGSLRSILGGSVWTSCTWAVGTFVVGSFGQHQYCMYRRAAEKAGMTRAMEIMNRKELERRAREARKDQVKAERRKAKDEEHDAHFAALRNQEASREGGGGSWKFW